MDPKPNGSCRARWRLAMTIRAAAPTSRIIICVLAALSTFIAVPAGAITIVSQSPNTDIFLGATLAESEYENPIAGNVVLRGYRMLEWRDADYLAGSPNWYDDWSVNDNQNIDGNAGEIWMRQNGHSIWTTTTVPSPIVSIHLPGDSNDGLAQVMVDGVEVAKLNMNSASPDRVLVIVKNLVSGLHTIRVNDIDPSNGDAHCFGAAALQQINIKWEQPLQPGQPENVFYGWNEFSWHEGPQIAADDWVCTTTNPVTMIRWWGSFLNWRQSTPPAVQPSGFHFAIWTDVPGIPGDPQNFSHPGTVIWEYDQTAALTPTFAGWDYDPITQTYDAAFRYEVTLPPANYFAQPGNNQILWLSIAAIYPAGQTVPNAFGCKTRQRDLTSPAPDDAVAIWSPTGAHVGQVYGGGGSLWFPTPDVSFDLAFELISAPEGWIVKWSQPPMMNPQSPFPQCFWGWDERSTRNSVQLVADDWLCSDPTPIRRIRWWGSYNNWDAPTPPSLAPINFHLSIWTDVPLPNPLGYSHPGQVLWTYIVPRTATQELYAGCDYYPTLPIPESAFMYVVDLPVGNQFTQIPGTIYWLCITATYSGSPPTTWWGWKTREHFFNDDAVRITNPLAPVQGSTFVAGSPIQNPPGTTWDTAFELSAYTQSPPITKWSQPPISWVPPDAINGWDEVSVYGGPQLVADDWICTTDELITDLHWWGSFLGWGERTPPSDAPGSFNITIWTDVPAGAGFSHPGQVIHQFECTNFTSQFVGWDFDPRDPSLAPDACFRYDQFIERANWFAQESGNHVYWISIAANYGGVLPQHLWGWKTTPRLDSLDPDDAVVITNPLAPLIGSPYVAGAPLFWPDQAHSWNAAFVLTSAPPPPTEDFGDAPDPPYPTLFASGGAQHTVGNLFLGALVDPEADGQPNPTATGDDIAGLPDEDGVIFNTNPLIPGQPAQLTVTLGGAVGGARLSAWIDFNGDGNWAVPATDQIFVAQALVPGPNVLPFVVPATATPNITTFARFRVHTNPGGIPFVGPLPYGEVEDYQVQIGRALEAKWSQQPHGNLEGFDAPSDVWWNAPPAGSKWQQGPDVSQPALHAHDGPPGTQLILANDWWCQGGLVTDLHWWGTIEQSSPPNNQWGFMLSIHANNAALCLPLDPPIWTANVPLAQISVSNTGLVNAGGETIYLYKYMLPTPFAQAAGQRYWFDVSSISINPATPVMWKWQLSGTPGVLCPGATKQTPSPGSWGPIPIGTAEPAFTITSTATADPINKVVADDFVSDGRPILRVRWWGSYLDPRYAPGAGTDPLHVLDGWFISFHHQVPGRLCPPDSLAGDNPSVLAVYFAPLAAVQITPTGTVDCFNQAVYQYVVDLSQCCLICSEVDPRTPGIAPAQPDRFAESQRLQYWLDIQAVTGAVWLPSMIEGCTLQLTGHLPPENGPHFWGWHTSPGSVNQLCGGLNEACTGRITNFVHQWPNCWSYGNWVKQPWLCPSPAPPPVQMAFELISDQPAPNLPPWIVQDPASLTICEGDAARFEVWACGTPVLSYQWYKVMLPPPNLPVGGNSPVLTINPAQLTDAGNYFVVVTDGFGSATSNQAALTVWDRGSGDADFNGLVNGEDIQEFVGVLLGVDTDPHRICVCDMNGVGGVTPADVPQFVTKLLGP